VVLALVLAHQRQQEGERLYRERLLMVADEREHCVRYGLVADPIENTRHVVSPWP
jgi:hypothetical protein